MHDCLETPLQEYGGEGTCLNPEKEMAEDYEPGANVRNMKEGDDNCRL